MKPDNIYRIKDLFKEMEYELENNDNKESEEIVRAKLFVTKKIEQAVYNEMVSIFTDETKEKIKTRNMIINELESLHDHCDNVNHNYLQGWDDMYNIYEKYIFNLIEEYACNAK